MPAGEAVIDGTLGQQVVGQHVPSAGCVLLVENGIDDLADIDGLVTDDRDILHLSVLNVRHELVGASTFPRHWVYDLEGKLAQKSGTIDFDEWYRRSHGDNTPWGEEDSEAFVTEVESALERELSLSIMRDGTPSKPKRL